MIATKTILQILKNLEWEIRPLQIFATGSVVEKILKEAKKTISG